MKNTLLLSLFIFLLFGAQSCDSAAETSSTDYEVWRSDFIQISSSQHKSTDSLQDHSQYLYLYNNGKALLLDSLSNGSIGRKEANWEIRQYKGREVFYLENEKESPGILPVVYPILLKNEAEFKMAFDSLSENHIWNLRRVW
ncbi:hypothetical protein [Croceimicrobium hydrocarbonivorans]|uniref:Lipocalin-like domain-containing protein n=1 Tax=Croceimicrobium hydrocarbonivorans TaxID=2761580 RepID=A0A7H0VFN1_9FLAO|nr:hypothetical protein [Croceimicrobium hydrocarbonivorans]QNR24529.1 hypothetical protein H4K34_01425 [Croceimicrobium hydrocarbonivorans]